MSYCATLQPNSNRSTVPCPIWKSPLAKPLPHPQDTRNISARAAYKINHSSSPSYFRWNSLYSLSECQTSIFSQTDSQSTNCFFHLSTHKVPFSFYATFHITLPKTPTFVQISFLRCWKSQTFNNSRSKLLRKHSLELPDGNSSSPWKLTGSKHNWSLLKIYSDMKSWNPISYKLFLPLNPSKITITNILIHNSTNQRVFYLNHNSTTEGTFARNNECKDIISEDILG